jgi:hypothetical protein
MHLGNIYKRNEPNLTSFLQCTICRCKCYSLAELSLIYLMTHLRVDSHYTARHDTTRHDTTRQNILSWSSHHRIHISPSPTGNDKGSVVGIDRREYFACLLTDSRCECKLVFVVSCRFHVVPYNVEPEA